MRYLITGTVLLLMCLPALGQEKELTLPEAQSADLQFLIIEALMNNPEIRAAVHGMTEAESRIPQAGSLDDPVLTFRAMEFPALKFGDARYLNLELMQMVRFPTKLAAQKKIASIQAEHAHHDHLEKILEVLAKLKKAYYELWFVQQNQILNRENLNLLKRVAASAQARLRVGAAMQQEVLRAQVEIARLENKQVTLRQEELSAKAMLAAILNRSASDTIGYAVIPEVVTFDLNLDSLIERAVRERPMLVHDSLTVEQNRSLLSLARQEFLPDLKFGVEYVRMPMTNFRGWSVTANITVPFSLWTLRKANARVEEAKASVARARETYTASRNMVISSIRDLFYKTKAAKQRLDAYRTTVIPRAQQSLNAGLASYQTGQMEYLMLIDAYRTLVELTEEYFMTRMQFEQTLAEIERAVGYQGLWSFGKEREQ